MTPALLQAVGDVPGPKPIENPGCQFAGWDCDKPGEVLVTVEGIGAERVLCRGHVGFFMLASTSDERVATVHVRRLEPLRGAVEPSLVRRAS